MSTYSISDLARELEVTTRTIRFYEERGMITPVRRGQERVYSARDRVSLRLILRGKRIGFSLADCKELIDMYDQRSGNEKQLERLLEKILERRGQLDRQARDIYLMQAELDGLSLKCHAALVAIQKPVPIFDVPIIK